MYAGTTQESGQMAGAVRPVTCAVHLIPIGIGAPMHEHTWLQVSTDKPVSANLPVFATDRPTRRLSERFP
jgi:hypothetical protein